MRTWHWAIFSCGLFFGVASMTEGQEYGKPDRGKPGDEMIQQYLNRVTQQIHERFMENVKTVEDWTKLRARYKDEYFYMLGLSPMPEKTPLHATVTGTLEKDDYAVDMLHYQSMPHLYVTANLYRPKNIPAGGSLDSKARSGRGQATRNDVGPGAWGLPAVLYVCGHSPRGRNGNKTAYQSHGIWFARHGYICLVLDSLQLGEIGAIHHGTYSEGRWWWHSRGYTPAGVECLNGMRGIDYLISRPDVDPERIAVTGISGGGAATFWIAAADERAKVAVPVSGMADLMSYVPNRVINGHCDCMFLYNTFEWPWTRIASLIAPRALLFVNSDNDSIFPMDANHRVINRLERLYSLYGAGDFVDSVVSIGGHAYRQDIRQAAFRFINTHLKNDAKVVTDSEVDLVTGSDNDTRHPIEPQMLRVFPKDSDIPADELNRTIDQHFVPMAYIAPPGKSDYEAWKAGLLKELRRVAFRYFPERIAPARVLQEAANSVRLESEGGIEVQLSVIEPESAKEPKRILMVVENADSNDSSPDWLGRIRQPGDCVYLCSPRGVGPTRWTRKNPPNYVERSHVLLGRTVDAGRVWDVIASARYLHDKHGGQVPVHVVGEGPAGVLAVYAALWEPQIAGVELNKPLLFHMKAETPQFLNVLRVCDVQDVMGMLAPRELTVYGGDEPLGKVAEIYAAAGAPKSFVRRQD